ncbi:prephenate dehydrogenase [Candidatus Sulfidibacterium hydrothermale]|uniref:prephenate dehydrogenase n=1 Tax=Candidatus Sulfidibacterium hydrothermale TaxID=2875962 RepID=UPI001F0AB08F|nr:prephenate dehydrogenase [Candidatus Sulfidibacterium hydrothermale]UBM62762.1 prephenate dehydrogenase [Candidatus Sulfidibacterium hydrothermale]
MNVCVVGIGLIGGSMALDLKKREFAQKVVGVDVNPQHANIAKLSRLVDDVMELEEAIRISDLVIVATPINVTKKLLPEILTLCQGTQKVVTDVGSTKAGILQKIADHPNRKQFVASHPMAGTEFSGPLAAISRLFDYKTAIICEKENSSPAALEMVEQMYETLHMKVIYMQPHEHDVSAAYVSHISHISAFALSLAVLEKEKDEKRILDLASGGFASTVRLAKSSAEMWVPVFDQNSDYVLEVLDTYIHKLEAFREAIQKKDHDEITRLIHESNKIQKIL